MQEEIIQSVLDGKDTLALLPTGGGKSVCFQVPALMRDGLCVVITPLIALMNDQVEQLKQRGIEAVAVHAGMPRRQIDLYLNNAIYGNIKFLYVSPERLQTELFRERVKQMKLSLIAVDEAHCISQWGYDFRPPYLQIPMLRELVPEVPVMALTATATTQVKEDIMDKLAFRKPAGVFQKSFARDNLSFVVRKTDQRDKKLLEVLQRVPGCAIIYVRSRKATQEVAKWLTSRGVSATFYHAGLDFQERTKRQEDWIKNVHRVMVATNAFGMGIDKPDVRLVIHIDLPDNLEAYYQEAGRAGRDGVRSYAAVIYQDADVISLQQKVNVSQPATAYLKQVYQALANYFQLAVGSGEGESFDFDFNLFMERFSLHAGEAYSALKKLEEEGLIEFNESFYSPSQVFIPTDKAKLYEFQVANAHFDPLLKMMLRLFGGELFSGYTKISEAYLAKGLKTKEEAIVKELLHLSELSVLHYVPAKDKAQVMFVLARQNAETLPLNHKRLAERRQLALDKMKAMINFVTQNHRCRMQVVQEYFDEVTYRVCGMCDVCVEKRKHENQSSYQEMKDEIVVVLGKEAMPVEALEERIAPKHQDIFVDVVREMVDEGTLVYDDQWRLRLSVNKRR